MHFGLMSVCDGTPLPPPSLLPLPREKELHADGVHAVPLSEENFERFLKESDLTFVAFHAPW